MKYACTKRYRPVLIFLSAIFMSSTGLLINASKNELGKIPYSSTSVNLCSEALKCLFCILATLSSRIFSSSPSPPRQKLSMRETLFFSLPALLYMIDNNLSFTILQYLDPATLSVVWNLKILTTAILYRMILKRILSHLQWLSIILLLFGIITTQGHHLEQATAHDNNHQKNDDINNQNYYIMALGLVGIAVTLSSLAGICCEYALKKRPDISFVQQNIYFCGYGILFNGIAVLVKDGIYSIFDGFTEITMIIIGITSCSGLLVGYMFKALDNIAVVFSHAESMMLTALVSFFFFQFKIHVEFVCGVGVSIIAMYLYDCNPENLVIKKQTNYESINDSNATELELKKLENGAGVLPTEKRLLLSRNSMTTTNTTSTATQDGANESSPNSALEKISYLISNNFEQPV